MIDYLLWELDLGTNFNAIVETNLINLVAKCVMDVTFSSLNPNIFTFRIVVQERSTNSSPKLAGVLLH